MNGEIAHIGQRVEPLSDRIQVEGKELTTSEQLRYFLVNKPVGYISTTADELNRKTVLDLLPRIPERLYPVGRLDKDSEGLMLLTNDGTLAQFLTHPKSQVPKTYHVLVSGTPSGRALMHLRRGVKLKEGYTQPAEVEVLTTEQGNTWLEITITEGRNREVRRILERVGYETLELIRLQIGPFDLEMLDEQRAVELSKNEVDELMLEYRS